MLFNSLEFAIFAIAIYVCYLICTHRWQNRLLLVASYFFYGLWDWRFTLLIAITTILDFSCGLKIHGATTTHRKKIFLICSLVGNLGILGFFKYFNFFAASLQTLLGFFGFAGDPLLFNIILPVGISFYTFKSLSYTIDIYRGELHPTKKLFDYALYVSFFPQLLAGPIDRARDLLPQILAKRSLTPVKFYEGCYLIFWGLFLKIFIADNLGRIIDPVFDAPPPYNGLNIAIAACAFSIQVYCDFAGYSEIARGLGKCMGFDIIKNFNLPFFSTSIGEFWRRWHISLSGWFRDYVYTPIVISKRDWGMWGTLYALLFSFVLVGFWHGAKWNFILFGFLQGAILCYEALTQKRRKKLAKRLPTFITKGTGIFYTFLFFSFSCIFFRANTVADAAHMVYDLIFNFSKRTAVVQTIKEILFFTWPLICMQIFQYKRASLLAVLTLPPWVRAMIYFIMYYLIIVYGVEGGKEFIYFQF